MKNISKFIKVDEWNDLTFSFLKREIAIRKKELSKDKTVTFNRVSMDTKKWVVRANPDGSVSILAPLL